MNALCTAPSRPVRNPTTRGETCRCVDESFAPTRALRAVWTSPWTTPTRCPAPCPHSRASRPQAPQDQPPVILTGQHRTSLRRGCLHRPFKTTSASHSNRSQHRPRAGSPPTLQAHFRMGLDFDRWRELPAARALRAKDDRRVHGTSGADPPRLRGCKQCESGRVTCRGVWSIHGKRRRRRLRRLPRMGSTHGPGVFCALT